MQTMTAASISNIDEARASTRAALTLSEAARLLEVDPRTISASVAAGEFPAIRIGRRILIPREKFLAMLDGQSVGAAR